MDPVTSASTASQALSPTFTFKFYLSKECKVSLCVKEAFDELNNFYTSHSNTMPNATQFAEVLSKKGVTTMDDEAMVRTLLITHLATDIVLARNDKDIVWQLRFWLEQLNDHPSSTLVEKVTGFIVEYHGWLTLSFLGNFHHFHDYDTFKFVIEFLMKTKPGSKILQEAILLGGEHFAAPNASLFLKLKEVMESKNANGERCYEVLFDKDLFSSPYFKKFITKSKRYYESHICNLIEGNWWFLNLVVDSNKNPPNKTLPFLWQRQAQLQFADKIDSEAYPKVDLWISWGLFLSETPQELGEFFSHFSHCEHYVMHMIKTSSNTPENLSFLVKVCYDDLTLDALLKEISNDRKLLESTLSKEMHHLCKVLISHEPPVSYKRRKMSTDFVCNPQVLYQNEKQVTLSFLRVLLKSNIRENVPWYVNSFLQEFANFDEESQGLLVSSLIHESLKLFRQDPNRYIYWSKFFNDVLLGIDDASLQKGLASFKQDREQSIQLKFDYYLQGDLNKIVKEKIESRSV